jgi:uncharacterized repeat protein (TIGR03803 family)
MTPSGTLTTLHSFDGADGQFPEGALVQATDGNFYGTTLQGGNYPYMWGNVFKMTLGGTVTSLHNFDITDGDSPYDGLVQGTDGELYGTTMQGGAYSGGTVFKITTAGALTTLHSFDGTDGSAPMAGPIQATNGTFYGTTSEGGSGYSYGTVFSLSVGLGPFVETNPTPGKVGTKVTILGNNLRGSTSVTFNGTKATFTVNSTGTAITMTVPNGATTGYVKVTTATRKILTSNVKFRVP